MINVVNDVRLITKVCTLYYIDHISQKAIAELLGLSRPTISRMIANGRKLGIVEIKINEKLASNYAALEKNLEACLDLKEAVIVADAPEIIDQNELCAKACAELFERLIKPDSVIGLSMGEVLYLTEKNLSPFLLEESVFVPLIGGCPVLENKYQATAIAEAFARHFNAQNYSLYAPARTKSEAVWETFLQEKAIRETLSEAERVDIALLELHSFNAQSPIFGSALFDQDEIKVLESRKAVGEICYQFYNIDGSGKEFEELNTTIGISLNTLCKVKRSVGIATNDTDYKAVIGAARGRYINTLIVPEKLAYQILEETGDI